MSKAMPMSKAMSTVMSKAIPMVMSKTMPMAMSKAYVYSYYIYVH